MECFSTIETASVTLTHTCTCRLHRIQKKRPWVSHCDAKRVCGALQLHFSHGECLCFILHPQNVGSKFELIQSRCPWMLTTWLTGVKMVSEELGRFFFLRWNDFMNHKSWMSCTVKPLQPLWRQPHSHPINTSCWLKPESLSPVIKTTHTHAHWHTHSCHLHWLQRQMPLTVVGIDGSCL